jgi:carboxyl-terminal processing protease
VLLYVTHVNSMHSIPQRKLRAFALLATGMLLGMCATAGYSAWANRTAIPWNEARLFAEVFERVKGAYVDEVPDRALAESAVRGIVSSLDAHSSYLDRQEYEALRSSTSGSYAGVGVEISLESGSIKIMNALEDAPAARAGVKTGDVIVAVDDVPVDVAQLTESVERMRGKPGTRVKLSVTRDSLPEALHFNITRRTVLVHSVRHQVLEPGYGYVRISQFSETTAADFEAALKTLQKDAAQPLRGLVLDLRGNPGGVLEAATQVADAMLDGGTIVTAAGRGGDARFAVQSQPGDLMNGAPIVVLVDGGSASAAEIVAGALKDLRRGTLIGQSTYGKGSVQTVMPLSDGGALKLTTSRYHTPSGASIQQTGIKPDVVVADITATAPPADANATPLLRDDGEVRIALAALKHDATVIAKQPAATQSTQPSTH